MPSIYVIDEHDILPPLVSAWCIAHRYQLCVYPSASAFWSEFEAKWNRPRLLLVDPLESRVASRDLLDRLRQERIRCPVVGSTRTIEVPEAIDLLKRGLNNIVLRHQGVELLLSTLEDVMQTEIQLRGHYDQVSQRFQRLTSRERIVCERLVGGRSTKEIAQELGNKLKTIYVHRSRIFSKLRIESIFDLVLQAEFVQDIDRVTNYDSWQERVGKSRLPFIPKA